MKGSLTGLDSGFPQHTLTNEREWMSGARLPMKGISGLGYRPHRCFHEIATDYQSARQSPVCHTALSGYPIPILSVSFHAAESKEIVA